MYLSMYLSVNSIDLSTYLEKRLGVGSRPTQLDRRVLLVEVLEESRELHRGGR